MILIVVNIQIFNYCNDLSITLDYMTNILSAWFANDSI